MACCIISWGGSKLWQFSFLTSYPSTAWLQFFIHSLLTMDNVVQFNMHNWISLTKAWSPGICRSGWAFRKVIGRAANGRLPRIAAVSARPPFPVPLYPSSAAPVPQLPFWFCSVRWNKTRNAIQAGSRLNDTVTRQDSEGGFSHSISPSAVRAVAVRFLLASTSACNPHHPS